MALILKRKHQERVRILTPEGDEIWIQLFLVGRHGFARLGFEADKKFTIDREEVAAAKEGAKPQQKQYKYVIDPPMTEAEERGIETDEDVDLFEDFDNGEAA